MEENARLFELIELLKKQGRVNDYTHLAEVLCTNKASITDLKKSRKKISIDILKRMKLSYPDVNIDWILTGSGTILLTTESLSVPKELITTDDLTDFLKEAVSTKDQEIKILNQKIGALNEKIRFMEEELRFAKSANVPESDIVWPKN
ncbi:transcriptional regulator [Odoribacter sp. OttesenSCG-928-J03]|nr:transcriptional regulator [Odoribacter sp. OttesenSCG-928-J03]MDL2283206.1 transcriptional regulator [Odoribacter sp. OttesenSCG-928-G04]